MRNLRHQVESVRCRVLLAVDGTPMLSWRLWDTAGRLKKKLFLSEAIERERSLPMTPMENGRREAITKAQVIAKQLTTAATKGQFRCMQLLPEMIEKKELTDVLRDLSSTPESAAELRTPGQMKEILREL